MYKHQQIMKEYDLDPAKMTEDIKRKLGCFADVQILLAGSRSELSRKFILTGVEIMDHILSEDLNGFIQHNWMHLSLYQNRTTSMIISGELIEKRERIN